LFGSLRITRSGEAHARLVEQNVIRMDALRPRGRVLLLALAALLLVIPAGEAGALSSRPKPAAKPILGERKMDRTLVRILRSAKARTQLRVIAFGKRSGKAARKAHGRIRRDLPLVGAKSMTIAARDLSKLATHRGVTYLTPDYPVLPTARPTKPGPTLPPVLFPSLSTLYPVVDGAPAAWQRGLTGAGVGIAIIDSGVNPAADFGTRLTQVRLPGQAGSLGDTYGHGSVVAGIAAGSSESGKYVGIAPGASIHAINVASRDGVYTSDVVAGLGWVAANHKRLGIRVVSLSLTETTPSSYLASVLDTAVEEVWRRGVVVVVGAGNHGPGSLVFAPANDPFVITVGALDPNGTADPADDVEADFSSRGLTLDRFAKPDVLAPGRRVASILASGSRLASEAPAANVIEPGYATMSGTSLSAPQVAGAAALLLQQNPSLTPNHVKSLLSRTARLLPAGSAPALDLAAATGYDGTLERANQGLRRAKFGLRGAPTAAFRRAYPRPRCRGCVPTKFDVPEWNASSWNASSWNASSWNAASWVASSWNASSWNVSSWNVSSWNVSSWN
jgi:serine protease AprX